MSTEQMLLAAIASLAGVVAFLFGLFRLEFKEVKKKLKECEVDREKLWEHLAKLGG